MESTEHAALAKEIGSIKLRDAIKTYLSEKSTDARGPAEYTFNRAVEIQACVKYRAKHGGKELAHRDGIKVMENIKAIIAMVSKCYAGNPVCHDAVMKVLETLRKICASLLIISKGMKSQAKVTAEKQLQVNTHIAEAFHLWKAEIRRPEFVKLHHVSSHVPEFLRKWKMIGRLSKEGFEAAHIH